MTYSKNVWYQGLEIARVIDIVIAKMYDDR